MAGIESGVEEVGSIDACRTEGGVGACETTRKSSKASGTGISVEVVSLQTGDTDSLRGARSTSSENVDTSRTFFGCCVEVILISAL